MALSLSTVLRRGVPEHALACAAAADRVLLENIAHLAQTVVPELNLPLADVSKQGEVYTLRIPASGADVRVSLSQLREIETYSPFRIVDVCVWGGEHASVVVKVATENRPLVVSEVDILRIKRKRV